MSNRREKFRAWVARNAKTFDLFPDYAKAVYEAWQDYLWKALLVAPIIVWWLVASPPIIPSPPMYLVLVAFAWAFLIATYYTWRKERIRLRPKLEFAPDVYRERKEAYTVNTHTPYQVEYVQVLPRCSTDSPVENCRGRLLRVQKWNGHGWEPSGLTETRDLIWSWHDSQPILLEPGIDQRLNLFAVTRNDVVLEATPRISGVFTIDQDFLLDVIVTGKDCKPITISVVARMGRHSPPIAPDDSTPMPFVVSVYSPTNEITSPKLQKPKSRSPYISGELGFFDSMVNMEIAQRAFLKGMDRITQTHVGLTSRIKDHTAAMEKIKLSGRDVFAKMRKESLAAAQSTNDASNEFEEILPELAESASVYFEGQLQLVNRADAANPEQRTQLERLSGIVGNLRKSNAGARDSQTFYLNALAGSKGFSGELDAALVRMSDKVTEIIQISNNVETRCDAIIAAIKTKLAVAS
ncbi:MAG: hypothetical protein WCD12_14090 [Candidatus Binatus sp.]|uniref:hypothetical protein n=1 Tax=Candidatus Binatus sp. TaxID=2811406 RepID=UPI003C721745